MKPTAIVSIVLCLSLAACTSSEETSAPAPAPEPLAEPAAAAKADTDASRVAAASAEAYERAKNACTGCPDAKLCQQALTLALQLTTAALQTNTTTTADGEDAEKHAHRADQLVSQFDGLAELSNECL